MTPSMQPRKFKKVANPKTSVPQSIGCVESSKKLLQNASYPRRPEQLFIFNWRQINTKYTMLF